MAFQLEGGHGIGDSHVHEEPECGEKKTDLAREFHRMA